MMYTKIVAEKLARVGVIGLAAKVIAKGTKIGWDSSSIVLPPNTLCRGVPRLEFDTILKTGQITTYLKPNSKEIRDCGYAEQAMEGQGALLSFATSIHTANIYGANRSRLPGDGAIIVANKAPFHVPISEHARLCPDLCTPYQKYLNQMSLQAPSGEGVSPVDCVQLTIGCDEVAAVVGRQSGVDFSGMLDVNSNVHTIYHVIGSGRGVFVDCNTCLVEEFPNPGYHPRVLNFEITLTTNKGLLSILEERMRYEGKLPAGDRIFTPDDAVLIMSDPELKQLLTTAADSTVTMSSLQQEITGAEVVSYLKNRFENQLEEMREATPEYTNHPKQK
ncbi:MAG: hypothetical protein H0U75_06990 [Legionella sp.]|nr:hypothetical protein [Legionella sp.]